ncbi:hypothetical protein H5410_023180 [Solanum commersonii]|uniref:Uncharacterized protein n=1 Tax=Solanum commersonii TaxID=4109 RepID=A0A9J5ZG42_SOLCO|nr:hypothetical protein H5410_023180 [Solanum commersonii]
MFHLMLGSVTFDEKSVVADGTRRLFESLLARPLFAPMKPFCIITFGDLTLAHYSDSESLSTTDFLCFGLNIF